MYLRSIDPAVAADLAAKLPPVPHDGLFMDAGALALLPWPEEARAWLNRLDAWDVVQVGFGPFDPGGAYMATLEHVNQRVYVVKGAQVKPAILLYSSTPFLKVRYDDATTELVYQVQVQETEPEARAEAEAWRARKAAGGSQ